MDEIIITGIKRQMKVSIAYSTPDGEREFACLAESDEDAIGQFQEYLKSSDKPPGLSLYGECGEGVYS